MSDILEVTVIESPFEVVISDSPVEVLIQEDNIEVQVGAADLEVVINNQDIEILTIAEQGPPGVGGGFPIAIGNTPPANPGVGDLWLDTN